MLSKLKIVLITTILMLFSGLAAQCGAPAAQVTPGGSAAEAADHHHQETGQDEAHHQDQDGLPQDTVLDDLAPLELGDGEKLKVLATTSIIGDLIHNVAGDRVDLTVMLPLGADPHTFSPAPQDVAAVAEAQVVVINGLGFEEFLGQVIANAGGQAVIVDSSRGVETTAPAATPGHGRAETGADPHIWMSPVNVMAMVQTIEVALSTLDPANAAAYHANADAYLAQLEELDAWVAAQISTIPVENREMVTDHDSFGYYADRYGLEVVGAVIPVVSTNAEPSARDLAELQQAISKYEVRAVFVGTTVNPALARQVAADTAIQLVPLYTGSLGEAGSGAETYLDLIRYNTTAIV
ncbi:MAG: zinc ABC transporter substrate-binding protein, partial [Anaerolineae bacterium]|nr:zinc ABC transporter substrate-binding protein [Anaerolineae bacterium]